MRGETDVESGISLDIGSVRLSERHLRADPPTQSQVAAAQSDIEAALDEAERHVDLAGVGTLVGVAGSITTTTAHALGLPAYDSARIHGAQLPVDALITSCDALLFATREQRAAFGFMHPGRVDVIGAGALIWRSVLERVAARSGLTSARTSETDILDGIALGLVP